MASAFPFSAPRFSKEEVAHEATTLKEQEKIEIEWDVYGKGQSHEDQLPEETDEFYGQKLREFHEELDAIEDKPAYREALERAPHLVEQESKPIAFLRCEKYDCKLAAERLVAYWRLRKRIFGSERAFLPMHLQGAMAGHEDYIREGAAFIYVGVDEKERPIVVHDTFRSRVHHMQNKDQIAQTFFYILHKIIFSSRVAQFEGYIILTGAKSYDLRTFDRKLAKNVADVILRAMPARVAADHIVTNASVQNLFISMVLPIVLALFTRHFRQRVKFHCGQDRDNVKELSEVHGIPIEVLPTSLGGDFEFEQYVEWLATLKEMEIVEITGSASATPMTDGVESYKSL